jgi:hypothetical protein
MTPKTHVGPGIEHGRCDLASDHPLSRDQRKNRRALARRSFAPPGESINAEAAPRRIDQVDKLQGDQKHIGPWPFTWRVVEAKPRLIAINAPSAAPSRVASPSISEKRCQEAAARTLLSSTRVSAGTIPHRIMDWVSCPEPLLERHTTLTKNDGSTLGRLRKAYVSLALMPNRSDYARTASLDRYGAHEVRLVEFSQNRPARDCVFWLELYCHLTKSSLDSCRCDNLDDAETAADQFISSAKRLHNKST